MKTLEHKISYVFSPAHNLPLDVRFTIPTLSKQVDISVRYLGLLFFVEDTKLLYIYKDSIYYPTLFGEYINSQTIFGIESTDYTNLNDTLDAVGTKTLGSLVTVFPLSVTYMFDGVKWKYHSGVYTLTDENQFNQIPDELIEPHKSVLINSVQKIILPNLNLSDVIIPIELNQTSFIENRLYSNNGNIYKSIDNKLYNIGKQELLVIDYTIQIGSQQIIHNLDSERILIKYFVGNKVFDLTDFTIETSNSIVFESYARIENVNILIQTF